MSDGILIGGVTLLDAEGYSIVDARAGEPGRRSAEGAAPAATADAAALAGLEAAGFSIDAALDVRPLAAGERRGPPPQRPVSARVTVGPGESALLLLEGEGQVYAWRLPEEQAEPGRRSAAPRTLTFSLAPPPAAPAGGEGGRRGPVTDWVVGKLVEPVRAYVLRFAATWAIDEAVRRIEDNPLGRVVMGDDVLGWRPATGAQPLLPGGRPPRLLLMVHGTFSTTFGSFAALADHEAGRQFLEGARHQYDLILGYDHRTLQDTPEANARAMLEDLERLGLPAGTRVDAIAYSRGGLVYRCFAEELLPKSTLDLRLERAVFVGCTNAGTHLAEPANWSAMIDLYTNILLAAARAITALNPATRVAAPFVEQGIKTLGRFVQAFSEVAIADNHVPGLAAMQPGGSCVAALNGAAADDSRLARYFVVSSDFRPSFDLGGGITRELAEFLADRLTNRLFGLPNDLVVDTASMAEFGRRGDRLAAGGRYDFGSGGSVYHTTYFANPVVAGQLSRWLLPPLLKSRPPEPPAPAAAEPPSSGTRRWLEGLVPAGLGEIFRPSGRGTVARDYGTIARDMELGGDEPGYGAAPSAAPEEGGRRGGGDGAGLQAAPTDDGWGAAPAAAPEEAWEAAPAPEPDGELVGEAAIAAGAAGASPLPDEAAASEPPPEREAQVQCRFAAEMDSLPQAGVPTTLFVTVAREAIATAGSATARSSEAPVDLLADKPIRLRVTAVRNCILLPRPGVALEGDDQAQVVVDVPAAGHPVSQGFALKGIAAGAGELVVEARQLSRLLASFTMSPIFVAVGADRLKVVQQAPVPAAPAREQPVALRIYETYRDGQLRLKFNLDCEEDPNLAEPGVTDLPPAFRIDDFVADMLKEFEDAWRLGGNVYRLKLKNFIAKAVHRTDALLPQSIRAALWRYRDQVRAIQVISDEARIPWELLYLADPAGNVDDERGFMSEWGLVRWLPGARWPGRTLRMKGDARFVIPAYRDPSQALKGAQAERDMLARLVPNARELEGSVEAVTGFLADEAKDCGLLHFACHGDATRASLLSSDLLMQGIDDGAGGIAREPLSADLVGFSADFGEASPSALVFVNACRTGQAANGISGTDGFASQFIRPRSGKGAGAFVGALWQIDDGLALSFADSFYQAMMADGDTLVAAVRKARDATKAKGDFTWLAYSAYGNPFARAG